MLADERDFAHEPFAAGDRVGLTVNGSPDLYDFLGGIGNMGYGSAEAKASGGFANLQIKPAGRFSYNIAYGVDNPVNSRLASGSRTRNATRNGVTTSAFTIRAWGLYGEMSP